MKPIGRLVFVITACLFIALFILGFFGISTTYGDITTNVINGVGLVSKGFGFEKNISMYLGVDPELGVEPDYDAVKRIYERRLALSSVVEYEVFPDTQNRGFRVDVPYDVNAGGDFSLIGRILLLQGRFELREGVEQDGGESAVILTNEHIKQVQPMIYASSAQSYVFYLEIELTPAGAEIARQKAEQLLALEQDGEAAYMSAWIDGVLHDFYSASQMTDPGVLTVFSNLETGYTMEDVTVLSIAMTGGDVGVPVSMSKIVVDKDGGFAKDSSSALAFTAFAFALLLIGAALIFRYRIAGLCGFISLLGCLGLMLFVLTGFYIDPITIRLTAATFGAFALVLIFGVAVVVGDAENVMAQIKSGVALNRALDSGYGKNLTPAVVGYTGLFAVGLILSDLFKRDGGFSTAALNWVIPSFSVNRYFILGQFGTMLLAGAVFSLLTVVLMNRLMVKSLLGFSFLRKESYFRSGR